MNVVNFTLFGMASALVLVFVSGCSSSDDLIVQQEKQLNQIRLLQDKVGKLEFTAQNQQNQILILSTDANELQSQIKKDKEEFSSYLDLESRSYSIKEGDTIYGIANDFDLTVDSLLAINPSISNPKRLRIGEIIKIR